MDRQPQPLRGAKGIPRHTHHPSHHGRLARRHRQHLPACLISGIKHLRHRRQRGDPPVRRRDGCRMGGRQLHKQLPDHQHRAPGRTRLHPMHPGMPRRQRPPMRGHRPPVRVRQAGRGRNIFLHRDVPPYAHPACPDLCPNGLNWRYIINKANQSTDTETSTWQQQPKYGDTTTTKSALGGNMYNAINYELPGRISDVKKAVTAMQATVAAQQRQIDKLTTRSAATPRTSPTGPPRPSATKSTNSSSP